jgi:hypothetical protein
MHPNKDDLRMETRSRKNEMPDNDYRIGSCCGVRNSEQGRHTTNNQDEVVIDVC